MQLQGELQSKATSPKIYRTPFSSIAVIVRHEGLKGIYQGLGVASLYQLVTNGCRLGLYSPIQESINLVLYNDSTAQSVFTNAFAGAASGVIGAVAGNPLLLVKTRLQSCSQAFQVGTQHNYKDARSGLRRLYATEGVRGLYRGVGPSVLRTGIGSSVQLPTYYFVKRNLMHHLAAEDGISVHLASSSVSGLVVCCAMHPLGKQVITLDAY
jgi:solute carrier family 25 protein 34/35